MKLKKSRQAQTGGVRLYASRVGDLLPRFAVPLTWQKLEGIDALASRECNRRHAKEDRASAAICRAGVNFFWDRVWKKMGKPLPGNTTATAASKEVHGAEGEAIKECANVFLRDECLEGIRLAKDRLLKVWPPLGRETEEGKAKRKER